MNANPGTHTRIAIALCTFLLVVIAPVFSYAQQEDTTEIGNEEFGSITGVVVCPIGDPIDGQVVLYQGGDYVTSDRDIGPDGGFSFDEIPPGTYGLAFYEFGEIPLGNLHEIEVLSGRNTEVTITIPFTITGMPCEEMLEMGFDEFYDFIYQLGDPEGSYTRLSEMGEDRVAEQYGECKVEENDLLIDALPESEQERIQGLRAALQDFQWNYFNVHWFQGSGAGHFRRRSIAPREDFLGDVVDAVGTPDTVSEDEINKAIDILDNLDLVVISYDSFSNEETEELFHQAQDELHASISHLREFALELPDYMLVMVADYVGRYLPPDQ